MGATRSRYAIHVLDWIFAYPIFRSTDFVTGAAIPKPTARRILKALRENGILAVAVQGRGRQAAFLEFPKLLHIVEG